MTSNLEKTELETVQAKREYNRKYFERSYSENPARWMLKAAKARAKQQGLEFTITIDDIVVPEFCPVLGIKLERHKQRTRYSSPSLDRIDNSKGYTPGNVAVISNKANSKKGELTVDEVRKLLEYMERRTNGIE